MEFLANDRLRLRIRRSAQKAGRFEPPLPSPSGGRLDSSKVTRRPAAPKGWLPSGGLIPRSSRWPPSGGLIPRRGVACYARAAATTAMSNCARCPTGTATRFWPSASGQPALPHQIRVAVPRAPRQGLRTKPASRARPEQRPRIVLTKPKENGRRYKIFINVTHPPLHDKQKSILTNLLSITSERRPLPKQ